MKSSNERAPAPEARPSLRHAMDYLHTWAGLAFSSLLFVVFFMGTLSVFDEEIDRWMMPATRLASSAAAEFSFDRHARPHLERLGSGSTQWYAAYPTPREPAARIGWREKGEFVWRYVDPRNGELLPEVGTWGGTGFFFPFHYRFHLSWADVGYWLLAIVSVGMLVLLVSGVIIHKKIFADFFTFRPGRGPATHRATFDLHNLSSVMLLPFHFVITLSGLVIFLFIYFKPAAVLLYDGNGAGAAQEALTQIVRARAGEPAGLASIDGMVDVARERWGGGEVRNVSIANPGDGHAVVQVLRRPHDRMTYQTFNVHFDGPSGEVLAEQHLSAAMRVQRFMSGLHMIPFDHWGLRWLYFAMGLAGCTMIATGLLLWVERRRARHVREGRAGYRVVDGLACASSLGLVVATLAMLTANRVIPLELAARERWEAGVFFAVWAITAIHAAWRGQSSASRRAWVEQSWGVVALALAAVVLNAVTTGDHPLAAIAAGQWAVAGVDGVLLAAAAAGAWAARRIAAVRPAPRRGGVQRPEAVTS